MTSTTTVTILVVDASRPEARDPSAPETGAVAGRSAVPLAGLSDLVEAEGGRRVGQGGAGEQFAFTSVPAAVNAAVELQRLARSRGLAEPGLRIGIATGEADIDGTDYSGRPVIEATRLSERARGGQILVTDLVRLIDGGRGGTRFEPAGEITLAGLGRPLAAAEVVWAGTPTAASSDLNVPLPTLLAFESAVPFVERPAEWERLELAWLAARRPSVILMDEPASGLQQSEVRALGGVIDRIRGDAAVVVIDHDVPFVSGLAHRLVAMDLGRVVADGTADEVLSHAAVVESYLGGDPTAVARSGMARAESAREGVAAGNPR